MSGDQVSRRVIPGQPATDAVIPGQPKTPVDTPMRNPPPRPRESGAARAAIYRLRTTILAEHDEGWTVRAIFNRHIAPLDVVSYRQFARYVRALRRLRSAASTGAASGRPSPVGDSGANRLAPTRPSSKETPHVEDRSDRRRDRVEHSARTFEHDPQERTGDYERLFGAPRKK
jgi:hypothetical protein